MQLGDGRKPMPVCGGGPRVPLSGKAAVGFNRRTRTVRGALAWIWEDKPNTGGRLTREGRRT